MVPGCNHALLGTILRTKESFNIYYGLCVVLSPKLNLKGKYRGEGGGGGSTLQGWSGLLTSLLQPDLICATRADASMAKRCVVALIKSGAGIPLLM